MARLRTPFRLQRANNAWIGVGAPIIALVLVTIALAFMVVSHFAREQDEAAAETSQRLVQNAMRARARGIRDLSIDFAVWNDAYAATRAWNARWLDSNYYSNVADGLIIIGPDGAQRYTWTAEPHLPRQEAIAAAVTRAAAATDIAALVSRAAKDNVAVTSFAVVAGMPAIISLAPIAPEERPRTQAGPSHVLAAIDVLSDAEVIAMGAALELDELGFVTQAPSEPHAAFDLAAADGAWIGALTWRRTRPGSAAFASEVWPLVASLALIGVFTLLVARQSVDAHVRARVKYDSAQEASRLKSEFIATMSHELRTPLNAIVGYAELIQEQAGPLGAVGEEIHDDAGRVLESAKQLGRLVNDILDQSRIDAGRLHLTSEPVEVVEILAELEELMRPLAEANFNLFEIKVEPGAGAVRADPVRLQQCLVNLAGNALKSTHKGIVSVIARRHAGKDADCVAFEVRDTGAGMDAAELARLFQPFPRPNAQDHGGAGLSLSITRSLARAMGGDVVAQSTPGVGATFSLIVPAIAAQNRVAA